jgi:HEAT repeat protein
MVKRGIPSDRPFPSVPDSDAPAGTYDEPAVPRRADGVPTRRFSAGGTESLADLRLRVEQLLQRREPPGPEAWEALGPGVVPLLVRLVDEVVIGRREALRDRVLATLGQLGVVAAIPRLGQILLDRREPLATRALAANAMGRIGDESATALLAQAAKDKDETLRRQVALALGRIGHPDVVPHLQVLSTDRSPIVVEAAQASLRQTEERLGVPGRLAARRTRPAPAARGTRSPAPERKR